MACRHGHQGPGRPVAAVGKMGRVELEFVSRQGPRRLPLYITMHTQCTPASAKLGRSTNISELIGVAVGDTNNS
jgi:hypothetical protein